MGWTTKTITYEQTRERRVMFCDQCGAEKIEQSFAYAAPEPGDPPDSQWFGIVYGARDSSYSSSADACSYTCLAALMPTLADWAVPIPA